MKEIFPNIEFKDSKEDLIHWGQDWTRFHQPQPKIIAFPKNSREVSDLLKYCNNNNICVVPSGGRTGLAGGAVASNGELVISLHKLNALRNVDLASSTIRAEAGVVTQRIQEAAKEAGLYWPVDLAAAGSCHIAGNIATNAGGLHVIRYGHTRRWVQSLEVVLMNGDILELNGNLDKNNTGFDFRNLFIGSEGSLGIITAATLKLCEAPKSLNTLLFAIDSIKKSLIILERIRQKGMMIHTYEVFSKNCLEKVHQVTHKSLPFPNSDSPYYLLLEIDTLSSEIAQQNLNLFLEELFSDEILSEGFLSQSDKETRDFWFWRENITESLNTLGKIYKNDLSVPHSHLNDFMNDLVPLTSSWFGPNHVFLFGHIGDGSIHVNLLQPKDLSTEQFLAQCQSHNIALFELVQKYKGSIAAEHGIGLLKSAYVKYSKSEEEIALMKQIKKVFDPKGLLNPNKLC